MLSSKKSIVFNKQAFEDAIAQDDPQKLEQYNGVRFETVGENMRFVQDVFKRCAAENKHKVMQWFLNQQSFADCISPKMREKTLKEAAAKSPVEKESEEEAPDDAYLADISSSSSSLTEVSESPGDKPLMNYKHGQERRPKWVGFS